VSRSDEEPKEPWLAYLGVDACTFEVYRSRSVFHPSAFIMSDGVPVIVIEAGRPGNPIVLLVNALGTSCVLLTEIARHLADEYHVISWESRCLRDAQLASMDADLSVGRHAGDAAEILAHKSASIHAVVSYCSGVNVAAYALAKGLLSAQRFCIISPSIDLESATSQTECQRTMLPRWCSIAGSGIRHAAPLRVLLRQEHKPESGTAGYALSAMNDLPCPSGESAYPNARPQAACQEIRWDELLPQLQLPTLVLHGKHDDLIHITTPQAVARLIAGAAIHTVDADHFAVFTSKALHAEVADFLNAFSHKAASRN
jgi:pimeloyl-ACP methyl ester carboxylesterase